MIFLIINPLCRNKIDPVLVWLFCKRKDNHPRKNEIFSPILFILLLIQWTSNQYMVITNQK
ncbi:MAG: hypothetical protein C4527_20835 [Candidatus Omnitrophota bacterium]|nr:MAG: hypothetical protein C4527_20835 [Candidatus Omnitrophota bacterium]